MNIIRKKKDNFYITIDNKRQLPEKLIDNISTIEEYIINSLTDITLEEDISERVLLKHKYLNRPLKCYLNIHIYLGALCLLVVCVINVMIAFCLYDDDEE